MKSRTEPFQRGLQAEVIQHAGPKAERQIANGPEHVVNQSLALGDDGSDLVTELCRHPFQPPEFHPQPGEHLRHVIVELS